MGQLEKIDAANKAAERYVAEVNAARKATDEPEMSKGEANRAWGDFYAGYRQAQDDLEKVSS